MRLVHHPVRAAIVTGLSVALVAATIQATDPFSRDTEVLGTQAPAGPTFVGSCDVDGVHVAYDASYRATPTPAGYRVVTSALSQVAPSCDGALATVNLTQGTTVVATGTTTVSGSTVTITFASPPSAAAVDGVGVVLAGGTTPIPAECSSMSFDSTGALSTGDDVFTGSKGRDLVYGLDGADRIDGDNKNDCLVGQGGNDTIDGQNHDDVVLGGDGDDVLRGGSGDDRLEGGPGTDRCEGGPGRNTYVGCEVIIR